MTREHVPVLAGELIEALDPQPGQTAIDCTLGGAGHARLVADRLGPAGLLIGIDRDPSAERAFAELAAEVECRTRFIRADFAAGADAARRRGAHRRPRLPRPGHVLDAGRPARARLLLRLRRAAGHAHGPVVSHFRPRGRQHLGARASWPRSSATSARSATRTASPARSSAAGRSTRPSSWWTRSPPRSPRRRASPAAIPPSGPSRGCASPSTTSSSQLDAALPLAWDLLATGGRLAAISFHSLEDRRVKRFLAERAQGCVCPPDLPVCVCGHEPEAELIGRGGVVPTPGEVAANPRAKSARLRAARKLG